MAVVGSRGVTAYGKQVTTALSRELAERGVVIVSGLALGVDGLAHTACLETGGTTVAVLANGLDSIYRASHTQLARRILEQGRDVLAVPGNITSSKSTGTNNLIKTGAQPATSVDDILYVLGIDGDAKDARVRGDTAEEQTVLDLLYGGVSDGHGLLLGSELPAVQFNTVLTMLEISGKVRALGNNHWAAK